MDTQPARVRHPMTWEANLLAAGLLLMILVLGIVAGFLRLPPVLMLSFEVLVIVPGLLWIAVRRLPWRATLRLHPIGWRTALFSLLIALVCWPVAAGMGVVIEQVLSLIGPGPEFPYPRNLPESVIYAAIFIVLAPIIEEPIFRGFVLGAWLRRGVVPGLVLSGLLFGLLHAQMAAFIPATFIGVVLGLLAYRSGSIYSSMVAHACYNVLGTIFVVVPSLRETPAWPFIVAGVIAIPLVVWLLWVFVRQHPTSAERMPPGEGFSWSWSALSFLPVLGVFGLCMLIELIVRLLPDLGKM